MTGLILGVAVDERERAAAELKGSLRLAAAGQMAAALAHELTQPLTALNNYAQAATLLRSSSDMSEAERSTRLAEVAERMGNDAMRASDVVKRLREFFRFGSTQLQPVDLPSLLREVVAASARRAEAMGIGVRCETEPGLPLVLADNVQVSVVLRNLVANALDSASSKPNGHVAVSARKDVGMLRVEVRDTGPGVDEARLQSLFEPGSSDKPGGMGIGLSICRAIVEAHGGSMWVEPGSAGRFCFTLPAESGEPHAS
jgi:signal transduction histidine kinase